jgi:hypothetical protein
MNSLTHIKSFSLLLVLLLWGYGAVYSQEAESKKVMFKLNNAPDTEPPVVKIISPNMVLGERFLTDIKNFDLIGEVKDESKIRIVFVNNQSRLIDESGIFASSLSLAPGENQIQIKALDEHNNLLSQEFIIQYDPPIVTLADKINAGSKYYGLIIGNEDYDDPNFPNLDNPIRDARSLEKTLIENYTFEAENITFLENATRADIIQSLDEFSGVITEEDNLLIFYAGHGDYNADSNNGFWIPTDADRSVKTNWFRNSTLADYLKEINSRHTLLITDACFAGSIFAMRSVGSNPDRAYEKLYELPSRKAMTSGQLTEVPDQSSFARYLIERLQENQDTYLSSEQLFSSFRIAVINNSSAIPRYGEIRNVGDEGGDFIFLKKE